MNTFNDIGFFSDCSDFTSGFREVFAKHLELADDINRLALKVQKVLPPSDKNPARLLAHLCYLRMIQSFEGFVMLAERGMASDAHSLGRNCTESLIQLAALYEAPEIVALLDEHEGATSRKYCTKMIEWNRASNALTPEELKWLEDEILRLKTRFGKDMLKTVKIIDLAEKGKVQQVYRDSFSVFSTAGTHTTYSSMEPHVTKHGEANFEIGLKHSPNLFDVAFVHICHMFIVAFEIFSKRDLVPIPQDEWNSIIKRFEEVRDEMRNLPKTKPAA